MQNYDSWIAEKNSEDVEWMIKIHGTVDNAYQVYMEEYLAINVG